MRVEAVLDESMKDCFFLDDKNPSGVDNVDFIAVLNAGDEGVLVSSVKFVRKCKILDV